MRQEFYGSRDYVADPELLRAVNIAMALKKPLLIKGEPGTGKTVLAEAVSAALGKELMIWNIKSTTKAQDGLYVYDVVQRLYDSQFGNQVGDVEKYVRLGKLGEAFCSTEQVVLLIDEIDKADEEFEAFLLEILSEMQVSIPEVGVLRAKTIPFVVLTSNRARPLSEALRRRCAYLYIPYPDLDKEVAILRSKLPNVNEHLAVQVAQAVHDLRENEGILKKPSIAETIDWVSALEALGISDLTEDARKRTLGFVLKSREDMEASGHCGACGHDGP